jgi:predicted nucleotidyltransferase
VTALDIVRRGGDFRRYGKRPAIAPPSRRDLEEAGSVARHVAALLKDRHGAGRVVLYGSLAKASLFDDSSDIDLMAWGIPSDRYLDAIGLAMDYKSRWPVHLALAEGSEAGLLAAILREGIAL